MHMRQAHGDAGLYCLTGSGSNFNHPPPGRQFTSQLAKEMAPILVAVAVWGKKLLGQSILVRSDNMEVVAAALRTGDCQDQLLMHLIWCLHFFLAHFQLKYRRPIFLGAIMMPLMPCPAII